MHMVFGGLKQKSNQKQLDNVLSKRYLDVIGKRVESLGIVVNIDEEPNLKWFKDLTNELGVSPNKLKIVMFSNNKKLQQLNTWDDCFTVKDFGWKGKIKNPMLQEFVNTEFDLLINYYQEDILELKMISAFSKAKFKVGILQFDERVNDLIIKTKFKDFQVFKTEFFKYLNILSKNNNE